MKRTLVVFALALSILTPACRRRESHSTFAGAPVIIISIDTMRADHLPMFGYKEVDTPALDALRKDSILFTSAYATSPLTLPSHASMRRSGPVESLEFVRGDALARMQRYDEAIAAFRREIVSFPRNGRPYASLYVVYMLTNRPAEARAALVELAAANPIRRTFQFAASSADALGDRETASLWRRRAGEK